MATAASNAYQQTVAETLSELCSQAVAEFDGVVGRLSAAGVRPLVFEDTDTPAKPDAVFPNNWVSYHDNGDAILYPMHARNRRPERRHDVIEQLVERGGFREMPPVQDPAVEKIREAPQRGTAVAGCLISLSLYGFGHRGVVEGYSIEGQERSRAAAGLEAGCRTG